MQKDTIFVWNRPGSKTFTRQNIGKTFFFQREPSWRKKQWVIQPRQWVTSIVALRSHTAWNSGLQPLTFKQHFTILKIYIIYYVSRTCKMLNTEIYTGHEFLLNYSRLKSLQTCIDHIYKTNSDHFPVTFTRKEFETINKSHHSTMRPRTFAMYSMIQIMHLIPTACLWSLHFCAIVDFISNWLTVAYFFRTHARNI